MVDGEQTLFSGEHQLERSIRFDKHGVRLPKSNKTGFRNKRSALSTAALLESEQPAHRAELHWRIGIPVAALMLAIVAVPLAHTTPRQGRFAKIIVAIIVYIAYANALVLGRKWIANETLPAELGLWWVHAGLLLVAMILLRTVHGVTFLPGVRRTAS